MTRGCGEPETANKSSHRVIIEICTPKVVIHKPNCNLYALSPGCWPSTDNDIALTRSHRLPTEGCVLYTQNQIQRAMSGESY